MSTTVARNFKTVSELVQRMGPYLLIELILPGGTLIALLLFLSRRSDSSALAAVAAPARIALARLVAWRNAVVRFLLPDAIVALLEDDTTAAERDGLEPLAMGPSRFSRVQAGV